MAIIILLLAFIAVPILEIALFIEIGGLIGLLPTIGCIFLTAIVGVAIIRWQGFTVLAQANDALARDELPVEPVVHGAFLFIAGILLLTPGFFTDATGFLLLVPSLRLAIARWALGRLRRSEHVSIHVSGRRFDGKSTGGPRHPVIEGEVVEEITEPDSAESNDGRRPPATGDDGSPWRR